MKLFLTGATGFFGKALLRHLDDRYRAGDRGLPDEIVALSRAPQRFRARHPEFDQLPWLRFHAGDIEDPASLPSAERFSHVLHAAADSTDAAHLSALQRHRQIVAGTENLLRFACATGAERFLLTSSGGAYGPQPQDLAAIPEHFHGMPDPLAPAQVYGLAKRHAEVLCGLYQAQHGLKVVIARCFAFVGRDLPFDAHFAIGNFIRDALRGEAITVGGDGTPLRTYLDQDDLADWLLTLLTRGGAGEAYNVGSDQVVSVAELAHLVRDTLAPEAPVRILGTARDTQQRNRYIPDIGKAARDLDLSVRIALPEAIRRAAGRA